MEIKRTFDVLEHLKTNFAGKTDVFSAKRDGVWISYSVQEYWDNAKLFSLGLLAMGFQKGDKIVTASNNRPEWNFVDMGMSAIL